MVDYGHPQHNCKSRCLSEVLLAVKAVVWLNFCFSYFLRISHMVVESVYVCEVSVVVF